jgi:lysophospholipase L1-like esterase
MKRRIVSVSEMAIFFCSASFLNPAAAQDQSHIGIVDSPCPPPSPSVEAQIHRLTERQLVPNQKLSTHDLDELIKDPKIQELLKRQVDQRQRDWPNLCRYKAANAALKSSETQVVFMGDSITDNWIVADPAFFTGGRIGRGIGGQTSAQMVLRFYSDVIALHPRIVHLEAGANDLGGATGPITLQDYKNNILTMLDLAQAHHIKVVLSAILPTRLLYGVNVDPRPLIREINPWLQEVSKQRGLVFVDYGPVLADPEGGMQDALSNDGVHPTRVGYAKMKPLAERALADALK